MESGKGSTILNMVHTNPLFTYNNHLDLYSFLARAYRAAEGAAFRGLMRPCF